MSSDNRYGEDRDGCRSAGAGNRAGSALADIAGRIERLRGAGNGD